MVQKIYCDFCGSEIQQPSEINEIAVLDQNQDICKGCVEKLAEFLNNLKKG